MGFVGGCYGSFALRIEVCDCGEEKGRSELLVQ